MARPAFLGGGASVRENGGMPQQQDVDGAVSGTDAVSPTPSTDVSSKDAPSSTETASDSSAPVTSGDSQKMVVTAAQAKRLNQSVKGMIISVAATIAVVIPVLLLNPPSNENTYQNRVDVPMTAQQVVEDLDFKAASPTLPEGWYPNFARWNAGGTAGVPHWEVGYVTPNDGFIWMRQTAKANPTWIAQVTENAQVSGQRTVDGQVWEMRETEKETTYVAEGLNGYTVTLSGPASLEDLDTLARAVQDSLSS